jgi:hypothetical protein
VAGAGGASVAGDAAVVELALEVARREVLRYLGYPRARQPAPHVASRLDALWPAAMALVAARGAARVVDGVDADAAGMPRASERVALGLVTIGPELEEEARRRGAAGEPLDELILDAFGSAAAEAAAEALGRRLCARAHELGLGLERRISPGYGRWSIAGQARLLALLPGAALGVSLSDGMMMSPRKSVSFAARMVAPDEVEARRPPPCRSCELDDCAYRRVARRR